MPSVTIDAGVLAVPPPHSPVADAHRYVDSVMFWSQILECPWIDVLMTKDFRESLVCDQLFPFLPHLRNLFEANGIREYDAHTVNIAVGRLLRQSFTSFEDHFKVSEVLSEEQSVFPDVLHQSQGDALRSDLARCLLLTAILRKYCREYIRSHALFLRHAPRPVLNVRAVIDEIEHDRSDLVNIPVSPKAFEGEVIVCDDFTGLIECMDEAFIFANSQDNVGADAAIRIALFKFRQERGEEPRWERLPAFRIGDHFLDTAVKACRAGRALPEKILRSIVETLEGLNERDVHALRTGSGGNNPQQMRGKDGAMRRDIDPTYHLHYWSCEDGLVELATVSYPHDNFWIPE